MAAKALLTLKQQWGGMIGHLARLFGSEELVGLITRNDQASPLVDLSSRDCSSILEKLEALRYSSESQAAEASAPECENLEGVF